MSVELFNSLTGDDGSCSSPPPNIIKPQTAVSNISSISSSKVQPLTTGTSGFQSAFLNSISPEKGNENIPVGGASTQRRALQNLPQNTKLVRGPNGQYSLQKVQTIELTADQQNVRFFRLRPFSSNTINFIFFSTESSHCSNKNQRIRPSNLQKCQRPIRISTTACQTTTNSGFRSSCTSSQCIRGMFCLHFFMTHA